MSPATIALVVAIAAAAYMAWNIGANDVANAMGTSVGSGALTLTAAVVLAGIFEFAGATLVGSHVTETLRKGILDPGLFALDGGAFGEQGPRLLMLGMVAALLSAGVWLQIATTFGLPVSTTHSIVGAIIGFGIMVAGTTAVEWGKVVQIAASWVVSPLLGGLIGAGMFLFVRREILRDDDPVGAARRWGPHLIGLVAFVLVLSFMYEALGNVVREPTWWMAGLVAAGMAGLAFVGSRIALRRIVPRSPDAYAYVERVFARLQIATACFVAFAHGANDVANAVGPLAAVVQIAETGTVLERAAVPAWILVLGAVGIIVGLATWGYKVIATVGRKITELTPTRGFSAEFGTATTVLVASRLGLPVSTTHTLVGAVIGVGLARGLGALDLRVVGRIVNSWIVTIPIAAVLSALFFVLLRAWLA